MRHTGSSHVNGEVIRARTGVMGSGRGTSIEALVGDGGNYIQAKR